MTNDAADASARLQALLARLRATRAEIASLVGSDVDAVVDPSDGSTTYLDAALREVLAMGALQEREATFRAAVLDALPANVAVLDRDGVVIDVNAAWRRFAAANGSLAADAYLGSNYLEVSDAATGPDAAIGHEVATRLRAVLRGDASRAVVEYPCHAPDQPRWFRMIVTRPDVASDIGAVVTHLDITDVVRSERTLRDGERRMAAILDALGEGVCAVGSDGRVALLNPAARRLLGLGEGEGIGASVEAVIRRFGSDGAPVVDDDPVASALLEGRSTRVEDAYIERADGARFPAEYDVAPLQDAAGTVVGALLTFVDAGPRRALEASLAAARRLEALGQLTGGVAHDFNNLLTVIAGNAELLIDTLPAGAPQRSAELIRVAADRGAAITQHLLAFGRRQALQPRKVDLPEFAEGAVALLRHAVGTSVTVEWQTGDDVWPIRVDPERLEAALLSLATNARDALPAGGTVRVEVRNATFVASQVSVPPSGGPASASEGAAISVADDGVGIPEADLPRIFEPFFTTNAHASGAGLGLSVVHGFVHQSGGAIDVRSQPGVGTTVTMWLPRYVDPDGGDAGADPADRAADARAVRPGTTVLVVDDDPLVRAYASELLGRIGCVSVEAEGPPAALRLLAERDDVDVVFSDVTMEEAMDGYALAEAVRAAWPWIAVVLTSGHDAERSTKSHADAPWLLLPKPYGQTALADAIAAALPAAQRHVGATGTR